jgi:hypothetical protein
MMQRVVRAIPVTNILMASIGALLVVVIGPLVMLSASIWQDWFDRANPVAVAEVALAEHVDSNTLRLQLYVTRQRECETMKMVGFTGPDEFHMQGASVLKREDNLPPISYPVGVRVLSRHWLLSPVYGDNLWLYAYYECNKRIVKQRIVDTVISTKKD